MTFFSKFKAPPDGSMRSASYDPEKAIASEVERRIYTLSVLCTYVGWGRAVKHLNLARAEMMDILEQGQSNKAGESSTRSCTQHGSFPLSNVTLLKQPK
jgi:hypothetical protein